MPLGKTVKLSARVYKAEVIQTDQEMRIQKREEIMNPKEKY